MDISFWWIVSQNGLYEIMALPPVKQDGSIDDILYMHDISCILMIKPKFSILTEPSKSPASIAKSNKQGVGTCLYQKVIVRRIYPANRNQTVEYS